MHTHFRAKGKCLVLQENISQLTVILNVSRKPQELAFCSRILATLKEPVGIYFISEDLFTLASYYQRDLHDTGFLPSGDWQMLPGGECDEGWGVTDENTDDP